MVLLMALLSGRWKIKEKVSFVTIMKYQASQMPLLIEPHLAREP